MVDVHPETGEAVRPPLSRGRALALLALIILLVECVPLAYTFVTPALVDMATEFRTTNIAWSITVLTLSGAVFTPLIGKLGDKYGKKRWTVIAAVVFILGSVLCALAPGYGVFLVGRALQGVGLPLLVLAYGLIRDLMPKQLVTTGLGFVATGMGASAVVGPFLGGYLIDHYGFRGVFWFMAVYGAVVAVALAAFLPETPVRVRGRLDVVGIGLLIVGVTLLVLGVGEAQTWGLGSPATIGCVLAGLAVLVGWCFYERVPAQPLMDLRLLRQRPIMLTLVGSFCVQLCLASQAMLVPMFAMMKPEAGLGYGFGMSALGVSQITVFTGVVGMIAGPIAGRYCRRINPGYLLAVGGAAIALSCAVFALQHDSLGAVIVSAAIYGIGIGAGSAALPNLIVRHVPAETQGIAGGMMNEAGTIGSALGTQLMILLLSIPGVVTMGGTSLYRVGGFVYAFWMLAAAGCATVLAGLAVTLTRSRRSGGERSGNEPTAAAYEPAR